ncbi:energy-coupling factor ABC transporter permease [Microbacterium sp. zg.Y1084]|uniref:energy-coupling factor ABC transporter permease n=1 Tax=Microbacterium sp. zg.Y1084 TaxID=2969667 RepID=UPI00214BA8EB|nr:energy-coupling factor ABC transporter permease [Microbacterium sp. zg.Y1084]MCR2811561.1 energy-coupling factor ABC transporter permease [Microbacterium sp. zg.Y1084]
MHVPDGFLDIPTSVATGAVAVAAVAIALPRARKEAVDDRKAPMVGIVATLIFAVQMINFPVGAGTSGHLMGGALAAVLVGPATGVLCLTVVLIVQAFLFADGGLTALGTNITLIGVVTVVVGWWVFRGVVVLAPRRTWAVPFGASLGAFISVPVAAGVFAALFTIGGTVAVPAGTVFAAMVGWHAVIGVGEAVITALVVSAVVATRPDLVYGMRFVRVPAARASEGATV